MDFSRNLMHWFEVIRHDKTTKFEWPGQMRRDSLSDQCDILK